MGHTRFKNSNIAINKPYRFASDVKKERKLMERFTKEVKVEVETKDELQALKDEYLELSGKKPHHLWKEPRLKEEIAKLKE